MSEIALIEINKKDTFSEMNKFTIDGKTVLSMDKVIKLDFMDSTKTYINVVNDCGNRELNMLLFDYKINLKDYDKIFQIIVPLFDLSNYLIKRYNINPNEIKLFISEDCNVKYDDFIRININYKDVKNSFIKFFSENNVLKINCFPPIMFCFF